MAKEPLNEQNIKRRLLENKGDLVMTAASLGIKVSKLHSAIRCSSVLKAAMTTMERVKADPTYEDMSREQFADQLASLSTVYQLEGLNTIHELAMMDHGDNASLADVRLKAALALRGSGAASNTGNGGILSELNEAYLSMATRVKNLRATATLTVSLESAGPADALAWEQEAQGVPLAR
jgi:hypothetical protein